MLEMIHEGLNMPGPGSTAVKWLCTTIKVVSFVLELQMLAAGEKVSQTLGHRPPSAFGQFWMRIPDLDGLGCLGMSLLIKRFQRVICRHQDVLYVPRVVPILRN